MQPIRLLSNIDIDLIDDYLTGRFGRINYREVSEMEAHMYEPLLDHARRENSELVEKMYREKQIRSMKPKKRSLAAWLLLKLSDLLLAAGRRIRPHEIQVYNEVKAGTCKKMYMDLT